MGFHGMKWNKPTDNIAVTFPYETTNRNKRGFFGKGGEIYDPLGIVAPVTTEGKIFYLDACKAKIAWHAELPRQHEKRWSK